MAVLLVVLFLLVPILEIYVIVQVGQSIGAAPTVLLLLLESALGAWLVRREGRRTWDALRTALGTGRLPSGELADSALVLIGGTLLLTPGFVTDIFGFFLVLPLTRPLARKLLAWWVARRAVAVIGVPGPGQRNGPAQRGPSRVVPGEVIHPRPDGAAGRAGPDEPPTSTPPAVEPPAVDGPNPDPPDIRGPGRAAGG